MLMPPAGLLNTVGAIIQRRTSKKRCSSNAISMRRSLRDEYRNERRIEMAFEEQRFFDVRRWMIAPTVFSKPAGGINIFLDGKSRSDPTTWKNYRGRKSVVEGRGI